MPQDPAVIQRQIEQTRAELAQTLDAIADMVSPRRVADRANAQIKNKVVELRQKILPDGRGQRPALERPAGDGTSGENAPGEGGLIPAGAASGALGRGETQVVRTVRWDRVAIATMSLLLLVRVARRRRSARRR